MGAAQSSGEEFWEQTRVFMRVWRGVLCALLIVFFFYAHAIRYIHSYDLDCASPGMLVSDRWNWDFVLHGLYGFFLILLLWSSGEMLTEWYSWKPYTWFIIWNAVTLVWLFSTGIYLSVEAGRANRVDSPGNAFNDPRACCVFGSLSAWQDRCKLTGPCTPGVLDTDLGLSGPKVFQLVLHWLFVVMVGITMIYVPTTYKSSQLEMGKTLPVSAHESNGGNGEPLLPRNDEEDDAYHTPSAPPAEVKPTGRRVRVRPENTYGSSAQHAKGRRTRGMFRP